MTSFYQQQKKSTLSLESLILGSNDRNIPSLVQMYSSRVISFTPKSWNDLFQVFCLNENGSRQPLKVGISNLVMWFLNLLTLYSSLNK